MQNPGEEFVGEYLRHIRGCEFVQYNLQTTDVQGEIDVIGINMARGHMGMGWSSLDAGRNRRSTPTSGSCNGVR